MTDTLASAGAALHMIGWVFLPLVSMPVLRLLWPQNRFLQMFSDEFIRLIDSFNHGVGEIIKWALPVLVLSVAFSVFALSIFGLSWTKLFESAEYFHATAIMLGGAATLLAGQHVRVDIFHTNMSPQSRACVDFCGFYLLLLPACLVLLWASQSFVAFSWLSFEGSAEADGIRGKFLLKTLIPVFSIMMITQGLSIALRAACLLRGQSLPERPEGVSPLFTTDEESAS